MNFAKGLKVYSIFTGKCPVCHTGRMYQNNRLYNPSETLKMNEYCPHCNTKFKIEPSFFYGVHVRELRGGDHLWDGYFCHCVFPA